MTQNKSRRTKSRRGGITARRDSWLNERCNVAWPLCPPRFKMTGDAGRTVAPRPYCRPMARSVWVSKAWSLSTAAASLIVWPTLTGVSGLTRATISEVPTITIR